MSHLIQKALSAKRESKYVEFKQSFDPNSAREWCEIIKDIVAIANSGAGLLSSDWIVMVYQPGQIYPHSPVSIRLMWQTKSRSTQGLFSLNLKSQKQKRASKLCRSSSFIQPRFPLCFKNPEHMTLVLVSNVLLLASGQSIFATGQKTNRVIPKTSGSQ